MAAAENELAKQALPRTEITVNQLDSVPIPKGVPRTVFSAVCNMMVKGRWEGKGI